MPLHLVFHVRNANARLSSLQYRSLPIKAKSFTNLQAFYYITGMIVQHNYTFIYYTIFLVLNQM